VRHDPASLPTPVSHAAPRCRLVLDGAPRHHHRPEELAGFPIPGPDVLELARPIDDTRLAERLETAYGKGARILALDVPERETIVWALDEPPSKALAELRGMLLEEHVRRVRDRLV